MEFFDDLFFDQGRRSRGYSPEKNWTYLMKGALSVELRMGMQPMTMPTFTSTTLWIERFSPDLNTKPMRAEDVRCQIDWNYMPQDIGRPVNFHSIVRVQGTANNGPSPGSIRERLRSWSKGEEQPYRIPVAKTAVTATFFRCVN